MEFKQYEIWHDESKEGGYHHGLLFVPTDKKEDLLVFLKKIREAHGCDDDYNLKFAKCLKRKRNGNLIRNMLTFFSHIIQTREIAPTKIYNLQKEHLYTKEYEHYLEINGLFGCRFGLLKVADNFQSLQFGNYKSKVETTLRFALKGCCHGMFDANHPIEIVKMCFDGNEHHGGSINVSKILKGEFRNYCKLSNRIEIDARHMKDRKDDSKILMNFTDNIVGAWRSTISNEYDANHVLLPIKSIWDRFREGKIYSNINSRWYRSISLSEFKFEDNILSFPDINRNPLQQTLF